MKTPATLLCVMLALFSTVAGASHSFGGLDMCKLYPEIMPPGIAPALLPEPDQRAAQLLQQYCTQCHEMPGPGRHTAAEWPGVLSHMYTLMDVASRFGGLMGNVNTPTTDERQLLEIYLNRFALKAMPHKPQGYGARAFENQCSSCHALPDPAQYSHLDWQSVLQRMQGHMQTMKVAPASTEVMMKIMFYLQASDAENSSLTDTTPSALNLSTSHSKQLGFNSGSLLALGPFLLLVILGLFRWWFNQQKLTSNNRNIP